MDNEISSTILSFNANSLYGKLFQIKTIVEFYKPIIVSITETKIDKNFDDNELLGPDYTIFRNDRVKGGGGVLLALYNRQNFIKVLDSSVGPGESVTVTVTIHSKITLNITTFYRPPGEHSLDDLTELIDEQKLHPTILLGDFNLPDIVWEKTTGKGYVREKSQRFKFHEQALNLFNINNFKQLISEPTHTKGNTLDLVLVETILLDDISLSTEVLPCLSDHNIVKIDFKLQHFFNRGGQESKKVRLNFKKANYMKIEEDFNKLHSEMLLVVKPSVQYQWDMLVDKIDSLTSEYIPPLLARPRGKPWMTRNLVRLMRKQQRIHRRNKRYPTSVNIQEESDIKKLVKKEICIAREQFMKGHITDELKVGNSKPLYNLIKRSRGQANQISTLENCPLSEVPNRLADYFSTVYTTETLTLPSFNNTTQTESINKMQDINIETKGVSSLIKSLDVKKSGGPDGLSAYLLKS
jgi:hypothetical protein